MVGCICDIIAVRNVYTKARDHFDPLVENVSKAVVIDMIALEHSLNGSVEWMTCRTKPTKNGFVSNTSFDPIQEGIEAELERFWQQSLWHEAAFWLAEIDLHPILTGLI